MHTFRPLLAILALFTLSSCESTRYISEVTRFHTLPPKGTGQSFSLVAARSSSSIEVSQYLGQITQGFIQYGWIPSSSANADYKILVDWGISNGRTVQGVMPIVGKTGGGTTTFHSGQIAPSYGSYGSSGPTSFSGTSYTPATYGVVGAVPTVDTVYDRFLLVIIKDQNNRNVLEGKTFSTGSSSNISQVLPKMIDSFFEDFPGVSGKTKDFTKY